MGISVRTNMLENMFLYFFFSETEGKWVFTKDEIKEIFAQRYSWPWDNSLEQAFELLTNERVSRYMPGLLKIPEREAYCWQAGFQNGEVMRVSTFFTAHTIQGDYEAIKDAGFDINVEQIYQDARYAFEKVRGEGFEDALIREDQEQTEREGKDLNMDWNIPF